MRIIALIDDARFLRGFLYRTNVRSWPKAATQNLVFSPLRTSALPSEADIELILVKGSAFDPKRTFVNYMYCPEITGRRDPGPYFIATVNLLY